MKAPSVLDARGRYERRTYGWSDDAPGSAFTHTVRLEDDTRGIELRATCTLAPGYEIGDAGVRVLAGELAPSVREAVPRLAGVQMVAGLGRRLGEVLGRGPDAAFVADAVFEVARLGRQVAKVPTAVTAAIAPDDAAACRKLDMDGWADLPGSCFTYSEQGAELLAARRVVPTLPPSFYSPAPGATRVFVRRKLARLVLTGDRLHLFSSMHDDVHGFDVHYEIDCAADTIVAAEATTSRLPYRGLCDEPQGRVRSMIGQPVDALLRKRTGPLLGGALGCAQLFDLTGDVLKLLDANGR